MWGVILALAIARSAAGVTVAGGGPGRTDCLVELQASGIGFPGGKKLFKGATCADGDPCDADGLRNGSCLFTPMVCLNQSDPALPKCSPAQVQRIKFKGKKVDTGALDAAVAAIGLPSSATTCSAPVELVVPIVGPNKKGDFQSGKLKIQANASTTKGAEKDKYQLVCRPGSGHPEHVDDPARTDAGRWARRGHRRRHDLVRRPGHRHLPPGRRRRTADHADDLEHVGSQPGARPFHDRAHRARRADPGRGHHDLPALRELHHDSRDGRGNVLRSAHLRHDRIVRAR
jgi:hypothetical protein